MGRTGRRNFRARRASSLGRKYANQPTRGFDSKHEAEVFDLLSALKAATNVKERVCGILRQACYELLPNQRDAAGRVVERSVTYIADFVVRYADGRTEVIDAKSPITRRLPAYVIKRKLMLHRYGIRVREM